MISIPIGFYANTSQRPFLKEIGLILNNKIREWINMRSTISRYLQSVEHQLTWKKENNNCPYLKKSLFWSFVLIWRKTRKRKPWSLSYIEDYIEEAWICRTGAMFRRFSVKRRQARSEHEGESHARGGVKKKKNTTKHLYPFAHQDRKTTKNILRIVTSLGGYD